MTVKITKLENIYGIKKASKIDQINGNAIIYSGNGGTKSSLAKGFKTIANGELPNDRIFDEKSEYTFDLFGNEYDSNNLKKIENIVVYNYDEYINSNMNKNDSKLELLTVSESIKKEYAKVYKETLNSIEYISSLIANKLIGGKKLNDNLEKALSFFKTIYGCNSWKEIITFLAKSNWNEKYEKEISILDLINENTLPIISDSNFVNDVTELNKIIEKKALSIIFSNGFEPNNYEKLLKEMKSNYFFEAGHAIKLAGYENLIDSYEKFNEIYIFECKKLFEDDEIKDKVEKLNTKISKNKATKELKKFINDKQLLLEISDYKALGLKILHVTFEALKEEILISLKCIEENNEKLNEFIEKSKKEKTEWESIKEIFDERFDVPFRIDIKDKFDAMIGKNNPVFTFTYVDGQKEKEVSEGLLKDTLSTGEYRALTILNFIYDLNLSMKVNKKTFVILDDIVDSFDYKNKFAMLQYISEFSNEQVICWILTHNFDFYTSCCHRLKNTIRGYEKFIIKKTKTGIMFDKFNGNIIGGGMDLFSDWKEKVVNKNDENKFLALLPVVRNLVQIKEGENSVSYQKLSSLIHYRENTKDILVKNVKSIFKENLNIEITLDDNVKVFDLLTNISLKLSKMNLVNSVDLSDKIIFSLMIRMKAEMILNKFDPTLKSSEKSLGLEYETTKIFLDDEDKQVFNEVIISIPEFIHLNSFMYEPLLDISTSTLQKIYKDISLIEQKYLKKEDLAD